MGRLALVSVLLLIVCSTLFLASLQARAQTDYSLELSGYTWNHTTITVSILPQQNQSWWKPAYLNATLHGIAQWNDAIQQFVSDYPEYSYLSTVQLVPTISYENVSGFDIYIGWIEECGSEATIGQSRTTITSPCITVNNTVCLAAKAPSGHVMTEVDMQNIVVHELGHTFGLYHADYPGDAMYATVQYRETVKLLSSLDLYALSQTLKWLTDPTMLPSMDTCPEESPVMLPAEISYYHIQIADENIPVYPPLNLNEYLGELVLRPEMQATILFALALIVAALILRMRRKKPQATTDNKEG